MSPERWQKIEQLYNAALELQEVQRGAYLKQACAEDDELRQEVESLLAQETRSEQFLETPALEVAARVMAQNQTRSLVGWQLGSYKIFSLLGAGGMGEVYQGHDSKLNRDVAIKVLPAVFVDDPDRLSRFQREARMLASLNHPNIAAIHGLEQSDGVHYLVMELVPGQTLAERLKSGALDVDEALKIGAQIAEALEAAHEKGVIHRDLKPANVKVTPEGRVKVLDFGLAKASGGDSGLDLSHAPTLTEMVSEEGRILGTPAYMSPEQARGKPVDKRTDIWAFGCVLYELLTGKQAFGGDTLSDTIAAVLERVPDWQALPQVTPAKICDLLRRCLQKEKDRRLRDIGDARIEIEEVLSGSAVAVSTNTVEIPRGGSKSRQTGWPPVVVLIGVALLSAAIGFWYQKPSTTPRPISKLTISLPTGQVLGSVSNHSVAISPDGSNLVYVVSQLGVSKLYVRPIASFEAEPIDGTEGALAPFFSPDGQWIGFFAEGKLKKIPVGGGAALTLCDALGPTGGSWGPDGRIYFGPLHASGIWRIPADGGMPEPVTTLDRQQGEATHLWPQVLPGGKAILFTTWTGPGMDDGQLAVQVLGTDRHRIVGRGASGGGYYVPSGHLVYVRGGALMAVPFDVVHLEVTASTPVELMKGVMEGTQAAHFSISDGGTLAYVPGPSDIAVETRLVWVDRSGKAEPVAAPPRAYKNISLSPDGRRVAIGTLGATGDIWIYDLARTTLTRFTSGAGTMFPLWTSDGNRVVYQAFRSGTRNLYWRAADGTGSEELLAAGEDDKIPGSWSPDGRILAFKQLDPKTGNDICVLDIVGDRKARPFAQTPFDESSPAFSPDGQWLAYSSNESGRNEVYAQPFPGPGRKWQISTEGGTLPTWARSGHEVFFLNGKKIMAVDIRTEPTFTVGSPRTLFEGDYFSWLARTYDVSGDGRRFLMLQTVRPEQSPTQINIVLNWFEELKRRAPAKQ